MGFLDIIAKLTSGFGYTLLIFFATIVFSFPLGLLISFASMSKKKIISVPMKVIIWIVRGIPLMLQILIIFILPSLIGVDIDKVVVAIIAFSINYACYLSEIFRSGIQSIPQGQYEAGQVLGMKKSEIFFNVIFKQALKRIVAPTGNEIITLVKDTALANVIFVDEIIRTANLMASYNAIIWPLFFTGVYYLIFVGILTLILSKIEKKMSYFKV